MSHHHICQVQQLPFFSLLSEGNVAYKIGYRVWVSPVFELIDFLQIQ